MTNTERPHTEENPEPSSGSRTVIDAKLDLEPGQRFMIGSFTIDQVASANLRTWRAEGPYGDGKPGWSQPEAAQRMAEAGWSQPSTWEPLGKRTYEGLESLNPDSRRWTLRDQLAACAAFKKPLWQLLLPPHECTGPDCERVDNVRSTTTRSAFHEELGLTQRFKDAREWGLFPYTGVVLEVTWKQDGDSRPAPFMGNCDRDELALVLFGIDADDLDTATDMPILAAKVEETAAKLQDASDQLASMAELWKGKA